MTSPSMAQQAGDPRPIGRLVGFSDVMQAAEERMRRVSDLWSFLDSPAVQEAYAAAASISPQRAADIIDTVKMDCSPPPLLLPPGLATEHSRLKTQLDQATDRVVQLVRLAIRNAAAPAAFSSSTGPFPQQAEVICQTESSISSVNMGLSPPPPQLLPPALSEELSRLEAQLGQAADRLVISRLAGLGEAAAWRIIRKAQEHGPRVLRLTTFLKCQVIQETVRRNAVAARVSGPAASAAFSSTGPFRAPPQQEEDTISGPVYQDCSSDED